MMGRHFLGRFSLRIAHRFPSVPIGSRRFREPMEMERWEWGSTKTPFHRFPGSHPLGEPMKREPMKRAPGDVQNARRNARVILAANRNREPMPGTDGMGLLVGATP